jgi:predicted porin
MGSPYQPTTQGFDDQTNPAGVMNYAAAGYKLTPDITVSGVAEWFYTPFKGGDYTWADPFIKFKDVAIWKNSEWNFGSDARIYLPATNTSQQEGLVMQFRVSPSLSYTPTGSRFTFGLYGYVWTYMYGQYASPAVGSSSTPHYFDLYVQPNISYQLTPTLALTGIYEAYGHQEVEGTPPFVDTQDPTDFQFGVSWDLTKWLNFAPYVQVYPGSFSWSSTSMGAYLAATVF